MSSISRQSSGNVAGQAVEATQPGVSVGPAERESSPGSGTQARDELPGLLDLCFASGRDQFSDERLSGEQTGPCEPDLGFSAGPFTALERLHREFDHKAVPGYTPQAAAAYACFVAMRGAGRQPAGVRFQVCLPTPMAIGYWFFSTPSQADYFAACERAFRADYAKICAAPPT